MINPNINLNIYKDGIGIQYKKFENGNLIFTSPLPIEPNFTTIDGMKLMGFITDYGRLTVEVNRPTFGFLEPFRLYEGGEYFHPSCHIEKLMTLIGEPEKIKFNLYLGETGGFGSPYANPAYQGQPLFSIPNDVILTKVP